MTTQAGGGWPWGAALGRGAVERRGLPRSPRPHDGAVLIQTSNMERGLLLVREGHRHVVTMQGLGTPRARACICDFPPPRTSCLRHMFPFTRYAVTVPRTRPRVPRLWSIIAPCWCAPKPLLAEPLRSLHHDEQMVWALLGGL